MRYRRFKSSICKEFSCFPAGFLLLAIFVILLSRGAATGDHHVSESSGEVPRQSISESDLPIVVKPKVKPWIALVIDDLGASLELSERAIALPSSVTLAFLPSSESVPSLARRAIANGHEVLIHMPMEPLDTSIDPGPNALRLTMTFQELLSQLDWAFRQIPEAIGLNNHMGSKFTQDKNAMATLVGELKARDMIFLDSRTTPETQGLTIAKRRKLRSISRDVFLDNDRSEIAIQDQFAVAEKISQQNGVAVVIGHPYRETFSVVEEWLATADSRGYLSVPISQAVDVLNQF